MNIDRVQAALAPFVPLQEVRRSLAHYFEKATPEQLEHLADSWRAEHSANGNGAQPYSFPEPESVLQILEQPEPAQAYLAAPIVPAGGNLIFGGGPKTWKTGGYQELAVALATGTRFMGRFPVAQQRRVGIVVMEGIKHRIARRTARLAGARGFHPPDLEGWIHIWHRPRLRFDDPKAIHGLTEWVKDLGIEVLFVDPFMSVAALGSDSNQAHVIRPQLDAYAAMRDDVPGLSTGVVVHAGKTSPGRGTRISEILLGSVAFGTWFDGALLFERKDEQSPVSVRIELRDFPSPPAFAFTVEDQEPASTSNEWTPQGWLRLTATDELPHEIEKRGKAASLAGPVRAFLAEHDGCSKRELREGVEGNAADIDAAFRLLTETGKAYVDKAEKRGLQDRLHLAGGHRV